MTTIPETIPEIISLLWENNKELSKNNYRMEQLDKTEYNKLIEERKRLFRKLSTYLNDGLEATEKEFEIFEKVRTGEEIINIFHTKEVSKLTGLSREKIEDIFLNYAKYTERREEQEYL